MDQLFGGSDGAPHSRLGLPEDAPPARIAAAAQAALARWQAVAEHPFSNRGPRRGPQLRGPVGGFGVAA